MQYAPTDQLYYFGKDTLGLEAAQKRKEDPDSIITISEPKPYRTFGVTSIGWHFPRLDLIASPSGPDSRLVFP